MKIPVIPTMWPKHPASELKQPSGRNPNPRWFKKAKNGVVWDFVGNMKTPMNRIFRTKNTER